MCTERTANAVLSLIWPRCRVCRSKFRVRLPLRVGFAAHWLALCVLLGSVAVTLVRQDAAMFTIGLATFVALKVGAFGIGRLEPDERDPITGMQLRRYRRAPPPA